MSSMMNAIAPAVNTGPVGKDDAAAAFRQDRLIVVQISRMSDGDLLDFISRWGEQAGAWAGWVTDRAAEELERRGVVRPDEEDREPERFDGME